MTPIELKIAYIGGGSRAWARKLMADLALAPDLCGQVALYDINLPAAQLNERLGNWIGAQPGARSSWRYAAAETLPDALRGADFVVMSIQPGTLECMGQEIAIAERYGMFFPVGDTIGAPGLVRGLRSALMYQGFAEAIAEHCPDAWIINYTNPMTICMRTLTRVAPQLKAIGCCHEVFGTQEMLADLVARYTEHRPARSDIHTNVLGINHFTFVDRAEYRDIDLLALVRQHMAQPGVLRPFESAEVAAQSYFKDNCQVKYSYFARLGVLPAAGDRHLTEFLPGFVHSTETLTRWGVRRTDVAYRIERWRQAQQDTLDLLEGRAPFSLDASGEEGVKQMRALLGLGDMVTNVNFVNRGQMPGLPKDVVVETNALLARDRVTPLAAGQLPPAVNALVAQHATNQELIVEAAVTRDADLAFQAILTDPNTDLPIDRAWAMYNEMLEAGREWLPGLLR